MAEPSITYDRDEFYRELTEVQGYLAELRYIDTGMAYLEEEEARWWQGLDLVGPGSFYIEIDFGTTFPFKKKYRVPDDHIHFFWEDSKKERFVDRLRALAEEANTWAADEIKAIIDRVRPFTWPTGLLYKNNCIDPVLAAHDTLDDEVSVDFGRLEHSLGSWEGDAADNFATNFYNPFEHTLRSQKQLLTALAGGITAAKAIAESTQHSLMNVVHFTREALREQLELCQARAELARQESIRNVSIIAGGAATVFGGFISGGGLWAIGAGVVAGGVSIASTAIPDGGWIALDLHGATAADLLSSMSDAIGLVVRNDSYQHEKLGEEIQMVLDRVDALRASDREDGRLIPVQPNIISGVDGTDFYLP